MRRAVSFRTPTVALLAGFTIALGGAGCGSDEEGGSRDARALLSDTFAKKVDSGDMELRMEADVEGAKSLKEPITVTLGGPFQSSGDKKLPTLDWDFVFDGADQRITGGLIATRDNAYVRLQGQAYEVGKETFSQLAREFRRTQLDKPTDPGKLGMHPETWLDDPKVEDGEPIGGDETQKITGSVNVRRVLKDVTNLFDSPAVRRQLERQGQGPADLPKLSERELEKAEDAIEDVDVEMAVDDNDVLRRFAAQIDLNLPEGGDDGDLNLKLDFSYVLQKVDIDPTVIRAPADPRPLSELLGGFGLGASGGGLKAPRD